MQAICLHVKKCLLYVCALGCFVSIFFHLFVDEKVCFDFCFCCVLATVTGHDTFCHPVKSKVDVHSVLIAHMIDHQLMLI